MDIPKRLPLAERIRLGFAQPSKSTVKFTERDFVKQCMRVLIGGSTASMAITDDDDVPGPTRFPFASHDEVRLYQASRQGPGRKYLARLLSEYSVGPPIALSRDRFQFLVRLLRTVLLQDFHHDYESSKGFLDAAEHFACALDDDTGGSGNDGTMPPAGNGSDQVSTASLASVKAPEPNMFLLAQLRMCPIWQSMRFWENCFFEGLRNDFNKLYSSLRKSTSNDKEALEALESEDNNLVFAQLGLLAFRMVSAGVPVDKVHAFMNKMCIVNGLDQERSAVISGNVEHCIAVVRMSDVASALNTGSTLPRGAEFSWESLVAHNEDTFAALSTSFQTLIQSEPLPERDLTDSIDRIRTKEGRMLFAGILNQQRSLGNESTTVTNDTCFSQLAQLLSVALEECSANYDFKSVVVLMAMLSTYSLARDGELDYLSTRFVDNEIWQSARFWEVAFYENLDTEFRKIHGPGEDPYVESWQIDPQTGLRLETELRSREQNIVFGQLSSFVYTMLNVKVPDSLAKGFIEKMCFINALDDGYQALLLNSLAEYHNNAGRVPFGVGDGRDEVVPLSNVDPYRAESTLSNLSNLSLTHRQTLIAPVLARQMMMQRHRSRAEKAGYAMGDLLSAAVTPTVQSVSTLSDIPHGASLEFFELAPPAPSFPPPSLEEEARAAAAKKEGEAGATGDGSGTESADSDTSASHSAGDGGDQSRHADSSPGRGADTGGDGRDDASSTIHTDSDIEALDAEELEAVVMHAAEMGGGDHHGDTPDWTDDTAASGGGTRKHASSHGTTTSDHAHETGSMADSVSSITRPSVGEGPGDGVRRTTSIGSDRAGDASINNTHMPSPDISTGSDTGHRRRAPLSRSISETSASGRAKSGSLLFPTAEMASSAGLGSGPPSLTSSHGGVDGVASPPSYQAGPSPSTVLKEGSPGSAASPKDLFREMTHSGDRERMAAIMRLSRQANAPVPNISSSSPGDYSDSSRSPAHSDRSGTIPEVANSGSMSRFTTPEMYSRNSRGMSVSGGGFDDVGRSPTHSLGRGSSPKSQVSLTSSPATPYATLTSPGVDTKELSEALGVFEKVLRSMENAKLPDGGDTKRCGSLFWTQHGRSLFLDILESTLCPPDRPEKVEVLPMENFETLASIITALLLECDVWSDFACTQRLLACARRLCPPHTLTAAPATDDDTNTLLHHIRDCSAWSNFDFWEHYASSAIANTQDGGYSESGRMDALRNVGQLMLRLGSTTMSLAPFIRRMADRFELSRHSSRQLSRALGLLQ